MVNIPRTELNNLYDEMSQWRNEVFRVRNRTLRLDKQQRNSRDSSTDEELDINNNETPNNPLGRTDDPNEDSVPHGENDPYREPYRHSIPITHSNGQGDDKSLVHKPKNQQHTLVKQGGKCT